MRAQGPLELVHSDVCGKVGEKSLSGGEYFVTFIDDYSRYVWIYILKKKCEVFPCFQKWKASVERMTGHKVKTLRSDNGGEYTSTDFGSYLINEGIRHELTVPHTPEQNGVAERSNRTLMESVCAMLADSKLPHKFWAEALSTAVFLLNRSPTKALQNITPYEACYSRKPDVSCLRIFGCSAYAHVCKVERNKVESKAKKCLLLGYGEQQKGYRLFNPNSGKVFYSRDVVFDEASIPEIQKEQKGSNEKLVELKLEEMAEQENAEKEHADSNSIRSEEAYQESWSSNTDGGHQSPAEVSNIFDPPLRRSTRSIQPPDRYGFSLVGIDKDQDPSSVTEALSSHCKLKWKEAIEKEMKSIYANSVWELVEPPPDRKIVGSKWVFRKKIDVNGTVSLYKARLVAQGCSQRLGLDYEETFSPVVCFESVRSIIAFSVNNKIQLHQMDVNTAFLHGELSDEVYMKQPEGYTEPGKEHLICRLKRSIYGLKRAPRCWNYALDSCLKELGFEQSLGDACVYVSTDSEFLIAVYVDDIILGVKNEARLRKVKDE